MNPIDMPMITLHWDATGWHEVHHGALRQQLPLHLRASGKPIVNYSPSLSPAEALKQARDANPGVDVQMINTVIARNDATLFWSGDRDRRAA